MKKYIVSVLLVSALAVPAAGFAQAPESIYYSLHSDEAIIQFNNLQITGIGYNDYGGGRSLISAVGNSDIRCINYSTGVSANIAYPCQFQTSYNIVVYSDTIVLLKNRVKTSISAFKIGDIINVYGFFNGNQNSIDALIIRDLSQPAVRYYTQVNNLTVQAAPTGLPAAISALDVFGQTYLINISANTSLLYRDRRLMPVYEIQSGDKINVYGLLNQGTRTFDAVILRDLSRPGIVIVPPPQGGAPVITSVSGPTTLTIGQTGTWSISAYDPDNNNNNLTYSVNWGDPYNYAYGAAMAPMMESNMQTGTFTHSYANPGNYTITFTVRDSAGLSAVSTLTVSVSGAISGPLYLNSIAPSYGPIGSTVTLYGTGFSSTGNIVHFGPGAIPNISSYDGRTISFAVPQSIAPYCQPGYACPAYIAVITPGTTYQVSVSNNIDGTRSNALSFTVQ